MATRWLEASAGELVRFSPNLLPVTSPRTAFLSLRRNGTTYGSAIVSIFVKFLTSNPATPPTYRLEIEYGATTTNVNQPWTPTENGPLPINPDRTAWSAAKLEYRIRTSSYDGSTYLSDGEFEVRVDGTPILTLSGLSLNYAVSESGDSLTFCHSAPGGDIQAAWGVLSNGYATVTGETASHAELAYTDNLESNDGAGWFDVSMINTSPSTPFFYSGVMSTYSTMSGTTGARYTAGSAKTFTNVLKTTLLENNFEGDGSDNTIPSCCDEHAPTGGGDTGLNPDPVGTLPPWMATCTGGGLVDSVADLADGESWL